MAIKQHIVRTAFSDPQWEQIDMLMKELRFDSPPELLRGLVRDRANEVGAAKLRYGPSSSVPRETKAERRARLEAMSNEDLTAHLKAQGAFDQYITGPDDVCEITDDTAGRRIMRVSGSSGTSEMPFTSFINTLSKSGVI